MVGTGGNLDDVLACGSAKAGRAITRAVEAPAMAGAIVRAHARPNVGAESRVGRRDEDVARVAAVARAADADAVKAFAVAGAVARTGCGADDRAAIWLSEARLADALPAVAPAVPAAKAEEAAGGKMLVGALVACVACKAAAAYAGAII